MNRLEHTRAALDRYAESASQEWEQARPKPGEEGGGEEGDHRKAAAARRLESRLETKERERLRKLEERGGTGHLRRNGSRPACCGRLADGSSGLGRRAIDFATAQIGKAYVWGAEGPDGFDCSGLTQRAWASAGRAIPRTSQEQWRLLPRVDTAQMRPGDLVIYFKDASHVGDIRRRRRDRPRPPHRVAGSPSRGRGRCRSWAWYAG